MNIVLEAVILENLFVQKPNLACLRLIKKLSSSWEVWKFIVPFQDVLKVAFFSEKSQKSFLDPTPHASSSATIPIPNLTRPDTCGHVTEQLKTSESFPYLNHLLEKSKTPFLALVHPSEPWLTPITRISKEMEHYATFVEARAKISNDLY